VAALRDGYWAVVDKAGDDLLLIDRWGVLRSTINVGGAGGLLPGANNLGNHLSQLDDGTLMLIDSIQDSLIFVRRDGALAAEYGTGGVIDVSAVQGGAGISSAATGYADGIAVIDSINSDLILLNADGTKRGVINIGGAGGLVPAATGLFGSMIELADGTLAVTDIATASIIFVDPATGAMADTHGIGGVIDVNAVVSGAITPQGLAELPDGTLAVFDTTRDWVIFLTPRGALDVTRGTSGVFKVGGADGRHPAVTDWAGAIGLSRNGDLFLMDQQRDRVYVYKTNGADGMVGIQDLAGNRMEEPYELEFTFDNSGPLMIGGLPAPGGYSREYVNVIELYMDEPLDPYTANDPANYEIRGWGANGIFGDADDVLWDFTPHYCVDPAGAFTYKVELRLTDPLPDGGYRVLLVGENSIHDRAGNPLNDGEDVLFTFTVDTVAPQVADFSINAGRAQRSYISSLSFTLDEDVSADVTPDDLTLVDQAAGAAVDTSEATVNYDPATRTATWNISPVRLPDGRYAAVLSGDGTKDLAGNLLDGDGDGTGGDPFAFHFHRLAGDANGDAAVDLFDLVTFANQHGQSGPGLSGDVSGDGAVDVLDLIIIANNFGADLAGGADAPAGGGDPVEQAQASANELASTSANAGAGEGVAPRRLISTAGASPASDGGEPSAGPAAPVLWADALRAAAEATVRTEETNDPGYGAAAPGAGVRPAGISDDGERSDLADGVDLLAGLELSVLPAAPV